LLLLFLSYFSGLIYFITLEQDENSPGISIVKMRKGQELYIRCIAKKVRSSNLRKKNFLNRNK